MISYRELLNGSIIHDSFIAREDTEWSNFWYDRANENCTRRYLIVGDSTARMVRSTLSTVLKCPVDMFGSSSGLHDELFVSQTECFFHQNSYVNYDAAFIQLGHHSRIGDKGSDYSDQDYIAFKREFGAFVDFISQYASEVIIESVFYSVVPRNWRIKKILRLKEQFDEKANLIKGRKNRIIKEVAEEKGLKFCDINEFMLKHPKRFVHVDHIHYENAAKIVIAQEMVKYL